MAKHILWDGQKSVDLDQYPPQAWNNLGGQTSDTGNDSREDRAAAGKFYETVAVLYRCVTLRQVGISRVPWVITRNGKDIWLDEDPMPPAQLAYLTDFRRLLRLTEAALCLSPEAFWFVERNRVKPLSLRWHSPSSIIPQWREADGLVGFKRILSQGHFKMFEPADYVYFALPNPLHETIPGRPAAQAALAAAGLLYAIDAFGSAFISRGAIKATLLTAPVGTSPTERDRLRAWWRRAFGGIGNAFGTEVISSEVKPVIVGEGLEQLNNGELTRAKQEEIATSLGVPHSLVFSNAANFATASQDDMHFYDKTVIPSFSFLAEVLNEQLLGPQGFALELRPESMSIYQEDEKERAASVGALVQAGMSLVLALEILGYDLTDEQWAQMKEIPEPVAPSAPVVPVVPVPTPGADIITEANNVLEKATFRRWAAKRKNPNPDAFRSDILTTADKAAVLAEMMEDADGGTLPPFLPRGGAHTHKATNPATPDPEVELRKRESAERKAAKEIAAGLKKQQAAVVSAIGENGNVSAAEQAITESHTTATEALRRALIAGTDLGTSYAIAGLESTGFGMDWTLANTEAQQWAEQHAGQLIKDIDATSLDRVRSAVASWVESGAPLSSLIDELAPTFGPNRASLIATTELTRAYAEGSRQIYKASGVVTSWRWETANDNLVCPICGPLNGKVVKIDAPFNVHLPAGMKVDTFDAPPSHVNCRCGVSGVIEAVQPRQPAPERVEAVTGGPRTAVQAERLRTIEDDIRGQSYESAAVVDADGNVIFRKDGRTNSVSFTPEEFVLMNDKTITHNHPAGWTFSSTDPRRAGNSFSPSDVKLAIEQNLAEIRAVTPEYLYTLKRPQGGWEPGFWSSVIEPQMKEDETFREKRIYHKRCEWDV
jgi:SPP1 gp7 family putative phage head morphogenesis protein